MSFALCVAGVAVVLLVAVPVLQGGGGSVADGQPLENVLLPCDRFVAYWNGKLLNTSRDAASGVYIYQLEIDGRPVFRLGIDARRLRARLVDGVPGPMETT